jgi:hypothetical protein
MHEYTFKHRATCKQILQALRTCVAYIYMKHASDSSRGQVQQKLSVNKTGYTVIKIYIGRQCNFYAMHASRNILSVVYSVLIKLYITPLLPEGERRDDVVAMLP